MTKPDILPLPSLMPKSVRRRDCVRWTASVWNFPPPGRDPTRPGHANMIASILDGMKTRSGTLAGDDTILLVLREGHPYSEIEQILDGIFPGVKDKCISK